MTPERLFNSFIPPKKNLYPKQHKFLATPLPVDSSTHRLRQILDLLVKHLPRSCSYQLNKLIAELQHGHLFCLRGLETIQPSLDCGYYVLVLNVVLFIAELKLMH